VCCGGRWKEGGRVESGPTRLFRQIDLGSILSNRIEKCVKYNLPLTPCSLAGTHCNPEVGFYWKKKTGGAIINQSQKRLPGCKNCPPVHPPSFFARPISTHYPGRDIFDPGWVGTPQRPTQPGPYPGGLGRIGSLIAGSQFNHFHQKACPFLAGPFFGYIDEQAPP
jgi:hypothetical protein